MTGNRNILVVGAGAVGQVYGYHLSQGGAQVTFLVKQEHRAEATGGFVLHRHRLFRSPHSSGFDDYEVVTQEELDAAEFDQVWLCVSATALEGDWLGDLAKRIEPATLVSLQPGLDARRRLEEVYPAERLVFGTIMLLAYQAPLAGEHLEEGIAYLLPPMTPAPFVGPSPRVDSVVAALDDGGMKSVVEPKTLTIGAFGTAMLMPTVAGLELVGWSLESLRKSFLFELATVSIREALDITALYHFVEAPKGAQLFRRPELFGLGLSVAPSLLPFDLEEYLAFHFQKTGDQTRQIIDRYIELGDGQGCPTYGLRLLRRLLDEKPKEPAALEAILADFQPRRLEGGRSVEAIAKPAQRPNS